MFSRQYLFSSIRPLFGIVSTIFGETDINVSVFGCRVNISGFIFREYEGYSTDFAPKEGSISFQICNFEIWVWLCHKRKWSFKRYK